MDITRAKQDKALASVSDARGGWFPIIRESFAGAWQTNVTLDYNTIVSHHAVFACMTLIARDIAKLRVKLVQNNDGIWQEITSPAYTPVLRKPNHYQTRIQFFEHWVLSKLARGNAYVLKRRDNRNVVTSLYVLDPNRVMPLVSDDGEIYYRLYSDNVSRLVDDTITVPASEIIHDRMNCLFHPLVGLSPIYANGLAATNGLNIQTDATVFFGNRSMPGGVLTAPGAISQDTAERLKTAWETNYSGESSGKIAVLGDGLKFEQMRISASDAQVIEQLKWSAEIVCSTFHVPPYKLGIGQLPSYNNIQALNLEYYQQALQSLIEDMELCLDEGLATGEGVGTEFDTDGLLRMDTKTQAEVAQIGIGAGYLAPDEARRKFDLRPVEGGDTPYLQQQNFSLAALAERDRNKPFAMPEPAAPAPQVNNDIERLGLVYGIRRRVEERLNAS